MPDLFDLVTSVDALREGFEKAARNQAGPGPDGISLLDFSRDLDEQLRLLSEELKGETYRPQPLQRLELPRPEGRPRRVVRLSVRDRVVHHALARVCSRYLDGDLHPFAHAYRPGRSGLQALDALEAQFQTGKRWVLRADIESFFDSIAHELLSNAVGLATGEMSLVRLVELLLRSGQFDGSEVLDDTLGAPQGSPLSPFLANLVLTPFDQAIEEAGLWMVRYGDDLCIPLKSCHECMLAEVRVRTGLERLGLRVSESKVKIAHLREGVDFLGFRLGEEGRQPGELAQQRLLGKLQALADSGRPDTSEEVDRLLQGWLAYYGPLSFLPLPPAVQGRAEAAEAAWIERRQQPDLEDRLETAEELALQGRFAEAQALAEASQAVPPTRTGAPPLAGPPPGEPEAPVPSRRHLPVASPLAGCPRSQELAAGCNVLRALVERAAEGQGLLPSERYLLADLLGRLGEEAERALDSVLRRLIDHKPGMARQLLGKIFPMPTSCARIRQRLPELAQEVGCDCRFRLQAGAYPTPVLHVLGAAEIPGLESRVQKATLKRSAAKAALDAINAGHKQMGEKAAALCAKLADLRRQQRLLTQEIEKAEQQLDAIMDEVGSVPLETPAGTLRRVVDEQGRTRFALEV